jgi:hypothetical protein
MAGETFAYFLWEDPLTTELPAPSLPTDRIAVARGPSGSEAAYYVQLGAFLPGSVQFEQPVSGATVVATASALQLEPAGTLATLTVTLPADPVDGQIFELSTTEQLTALTVQGAGGETVRGGSYLLNADSGSSWRYREASVTWFVRY